MKKIILCGLIGLMTVSMAHAQSLYNTVRETATKVVNNPGSKSDEVEIAQFEIKALNYISAQATKRGLSQNEYFFDSQAVNMKSFVDDCRFYAQKAGKISAAKKKQVVDCFKKASMDNPLFNDPDKQTTQAYIRNTQTETPFSLDTDWEKAYDQATREVRKIIK